MSELIIEAGRTERQYWRDLWRYRELFYFLAWRDLLVRYKQTVVGVAWSIIRPFLTMVVLTIVFGAFGKMPDGGFPYPILVFCGMLPWQFFSTALSECGNSLVTNSNLISKVYFPRLVVPASSVITSFVDFLISAAFLVVLMIWYRFVPSANIVFLPCLSSGFCSFFRCRTLDRCPDGRVSGFRFHRAVYCSVWTLHFASWFPQHRRSGEMAIALLSEPDGRRD